MIKSITLHFTVFPSKIFWNSLSLLFLIFKESIRFLWGLNKYTLSTLPGPQKASNNLDALVVSFVVLVVTVVVMVVVNSKGCYYDILRTKTVSVTVLDSFSTLPLASIIHSNSNHHFSLSVSVCLPTWCKSTLPSSFLPIPLLSLISPTPGHSASLTEPNTTHGHKPLCLLVSFFF